MADNEKKPNGPAQEAADRLEQKKKEALGLLLDQTVLFVKSDVQMVGLLEELLRALVQQVQKDPSVILSGGGDVDIEALLNALRSKAGGGPGVSGGDIVGGSVWSNIVDTIHALEGFLKDEKKFIMDILRLIFCGCKGDGW